jgi:hypothetical protein
MGNNVESIYNVYLQHHLIEHKKLFKCCALLSFDCDPNGGTSGLKIHNKIGGKVLQPHFGLSVRMRLTLPKVRKWSLAGLPKTQSSIARVKSPCI